MQETMRVVIVGCGRVGAALAQMLRREGHSVMIIDQSPEAFTRLNPDFPQSSTVLGDGTDEDVLRRAGIEKAQAFVAATNGDNRNILAAQIAQHIFHVPRVLCRIYDPIRQQTYNDLGLESISPTIVGATLFRDALLHPVMRSSSAPHSLAAGSSVPVQRLEHERAAKR